MKLDRSPLKASAKQVSSLASDVLSTGSSRSAATGLRRIDYIDGFGTMFGPGVAVKKSIYIEDDPTLAGIRARRRAGELEGNEGFIYVISNSAWTRYLKIGHAVDYADRLNSFQTSDPFRRYKLEFAWYFRDRIAAEKEDREST